LFGPARTKDSRTRLRRLKDRINSVVIKSVGLSEVCGKSVGKIMEVKMQAWRPNTSFKRYELFHIWITFQIQKYKLSFYNCKFPYVFTLKSTLT